jgi:hypothetical protein
VLLVWELGGGLGHLARLAPLARTLRRRGHRVVAALRDTQRAEAFFGEVPVVGVPGADAAGPRSAAAAPGSGTRAGSYADLLVRQGWGDERALCERLAAWRELFAGIGPDAVVFDHSPSALLAAQGEPLRRMLLGTGFACPPDVAPLPSLMLPEEADPAGAKADEAASNETRVLDVVNGCLAARGLTPLPRLGALFRQVDESFLTTWRELDVYADARKGARYVGVWPGEWGPAPSWPDAPGPRLFGYLKRFPGLSALLRLLAGTGLPALVVVDGLAEDAARRASTASLRVTGVPVDLEAAARECAVAFGHGTHGTTATLMRAGRPALLVPLQVEQFWVARRAVQAGFAQIASASAPETFASGLERLLRDGRFALCARQLAALHADFDPDAELERIADRIAALAGR